MTLWVGCFCFLGIEPYTLMEILCQDYIINPLISLTGEILGGSGGHSGVQSEILFQNVPIQGHRVGLESKRDCTQVGQPECHTGENRLPTLL